MSMDIQQPDFSQNKYGIHAATVSHATPNANGMVNDYSWNVSIKQKRLEELQQQLAEVDARIAEFDRLNPGVASSNIDIAAKRAEAGDMSSYNNLVNGAMAREQMGASSKASVVDGIKNDLFNAMQYTYGLKSKDDEMRDIATSQIRTALRRAEDTASEKGVELPSVYYELKHTIESIPSSSGGRINSRELGNDWWTKANSGTLQDSDIKIAEEFVDNNPNSSEAEKVRIVIEQYRNKTEGAKARAKAQAEARQREIKRADELAVKYASFADARALANFAQRWNKAEDEEIKTLKKFYDFDYKTGQFKKKGGI